jgi:hypothetical protein
VLSDVEPPSLRGREGDRISAKSGSKPEETTLLLLAEADEGEAFAGASGRATSV